MKRIFFSSFSWTGLHVQNSGSREAADLEGKTLSLRITRIAMKRKKDKRRMRVKT
jgi:hypothetical protein